MFESVFSDVVLKEITTGSSLVRLFHCESRIFGILRVSRVFDFQEIQEDQSRLTSAVLAQRKRSNWFRASN